MEVRKWNDGSDNPNRMLTKVEAEMATLLSQDPHSVSQEEERKLQAEHNRVLLIQDYYWHQRARVNWGISGDRNTAFFHAAAITRKRVNTIRAILLPNGEWITEGKDIRDAFIVHFKSIYKKGERARVEDVYPEDLLNSVPQVPNAIAAHLEVIPTEGEIQSALMALGPNKAPGPDGFTAKVIQENWDAFGPSILSEVKNFFQTGVMKRQIGRSNLVLILKTDEANMVTQFRPISVCNILYKVISKVLSTRMKPLIDSLISISQSAFIPGREISDNIILFREILHSFKQAGYKRKEFCLKVDLSKAFDRMDWRYLQQVLSLYGFPERFRSWVMGCVTSAQFSLVFNGRGDGFFQPECGLRQGCALSPLLINTRHGSHVKKLQVPGRERGPQWGPSDTICHTNYRLSIC